ncbi:MAG: phospholipid/cholesterol/gamma-HCH transport system ATP-binding protein [Thermodesulfobacteriota bacterium]|nr:phospholipid/cholesterol/gamma-HCH transport system ATP-binding protein [Thermodesulfobacteriota bacterium]
MTAIITVQRLCKSFEGQQVLTGLECAIEQGTITTIMGLSGAGKSVLLRLLVGLERPDSGAIFLDNEDMVSMSGKRLNTVRRRFGVLFQDTALFDSLSVLENVAFPIREHRRLPEAQVKEMAEEKLSMVGMLGHRAKYPEELSGGMRKRVGLARALALDPEIVFFDEPTSGLDPITRAAIYKLMERTHRHSMGTYVLVSHDLEGVLEISDELMMLWDGSIVSSGSPSEIRSSENPVVRQFVAGSVDGPIDVEMTN